MRQTYEEMLYERYRDYTEEQLQEVLRDDGYEAEAKAVAGAVLNSSGYKDRQKNAAEAAQITQREEAEKSRAQHTDPLYDDIHQMARDVRFIRNVILTGFVIAFILTLISIVAAFAR